MLPVSSKARELSTADICSLLEPITISGSTRVLFSNWARTFWCEPSAIFEPCDEYQCELILELARRERKTVRAAGAGHSPSDLACTTGFMVRTTNLDKVVEINPVEKYVIAQGGLSLHVLHDVLAKAGLAMSNVGSISDQTLAGIVTTATHGTGLSFSVISSQVLALELLLADGSRVRCSRDQNRSLFIASLCGLGATGLILTVKLQVEDAFRLSEYRERVTFASCVDNLDAIASSGEHVRMWWYTQADMMHIMRANRTYEPADPPSPNLFWDVIVGFHFVQFLLFLGLYLPGVLPFVGRFASWLGRRSCTVVDDSHRIFNLDVFIRQYTSEWGIPYVNAERCLREIRSWLADEHADPSGLRPHFPIEVRFSDADDIWLSPSNGAKTCWIGIIQFKPYGLDVPWEKLFQRFENIMYSHGGRPHWAKLHPLTPIQLRERYSHFDDFVTTLKTVDPSGLFRNEYVRRHIFGEVGQQVESSFFQK